MISETISALFCISAVFTVAQFNMGSSATFDGIFLLVILIVMYFMNVEVMKNRCGEADMATVSMATFPPWIIMFGSLLVILRMFPGWLQPFSNTIGYVVVLASGGKKKLVDLFVSNDKLQHVYDDPWALMVNFSTTNFDLEMTKLDNAKILKPADELHVFRDAFHKVVRLKDLIAALAWYMLVGSVIISVSYANIIAHKCQSANATPAKLELKKEDPQQYFEDD